MTLTMFVCNDMEAAWVASICAQQEREMEQWERDEDRDHEEQLAHEAVLEDEIETWPWYADAPLHEERPEIIVDADLVGLPVATSDEYLDDEMPVAELEAELLEDV